jgi:hypothetical protein
MNTAAQGTEARTEEGAVAAAKAQAGARQSSQAEANAEGEKADAQGPEDSAVSGFPALCQGIFFDSSLSFSFSLTSLTRCVQLLQRNDPTLTSLEVVGRDLVREFSCLSSHTAQYPQHPGQTDPAEGLVTQR